MGLGHFSHYGLEKALIDQLSTFDTSIISSDIFININTDSFPISKSSKSELWPILGQIQHPSIKFQPFIISAYHGPGKPSPLEQFLDSFLIEYVHLNTNRFYFNNRQFKVHVRAICDQLEIILEIFPLTIVVVVNVYKKELQ